MTQIKARVQGDIPANRLLKFGTSANGLPIVTLIQKDATPHMHSTKELEDGTEVTVNITNKPIWEVEAGDNIATGESVGVGENGTVIPRKSGEVTPARLIGYAANNAEKGSLVQVVRSLHMNGNWVNSVDDLLNGTTE